MPRAPDQATEELAELETQLTSAIDAVEDDRERFHIRKAAQHIVFARQGESEPDAEGR